MSILEDAKTVVSLIQKLDNLELSKKILDLQTEILSLYQENLELKTENQSLKEKIQTKEDLEFKTRAYWRKKPSGSSEGPFCSACWDVKQQLVWLHEFPNDPRHYKCPACQQTFRIT